MPVSSTVSAYGMKLANHGILTLHGIMKKKRTILCNLTSKMHNILIPKDVNKLRYTTNHGLYR